MFLKWTAASDHGFHYRTSQRHEKSLFLNPFFHRGRTERSFGWHKHRPSLWIWSEVQGQPQRGPGSPHMDSVLLKATVKDLDGHTENMKHKASQAKCQRTDANNQSCRKRNGHLRDRESFSHRAGFAQDNWLVRRTTRKFQGGKQIDYPSGNTHRKRQSQESSIVIGKMKTERKLGKYIIKMHLKKWQQLCSPCQEKGVGAGEIGEW